MKQIIRTADFTGGMPLKTHSGVCHGHTATVIHNLDELFATVFQDQLDARSSGIQRILQQFLNHRCRALNNFSCCDLIGNSIR